MNDVIILVTVFIIWFLLGFITFLISTKRSNKYIGFDDAAKADFLLITTMGLLSLVVMIIVIFKEWFEEKMDDLLRRWM